VALQQDSRSSGSKNLMLQLRRRLLLLLLPHLCAPREVAVVQTQGPELVVATTHTQPPHSHVRGELGVGRLATKLIPAISSRKFSCCCPEKAVADHIQRTLQGII